jgi:hypothetical protein
MRRNTHRILIEGETAFEGVEKIHLIQDMDGWVSRVAQSV